jgi:phage shock protein A
VSVTGPTRELACLALGHDDTGEVRCPATDERLIRELVEEVQRLRVETGAVEETVADRAEQAGAIGEAHAATARSWATGRDYAEAFLDHLADDGWRLARRTPHP